jgi:hypothetical protein
LKFWKTTANLRPIKFMESIIIQFWGWTFIQDNGRLQGKV